MTRGTPGRRCCATTPPPCTPRTRASGSRSFASVFAHAAAVVWCVFWWSQPVDARERARLVVVVIAPADDRALGALARERLLAAHALPEVQRAVAIDSAVLLSPPSNLPEALAHVWIDFTQRDHAVMLLLDEHLERGLLRYVSRADGDEIAREEIGHVLETAVEGLLAGETIGVTREELLGSRPAPPQRDKPSTVSPPALRIEGGPHALSTTRWHARSSGFYAVDAFGARTVEHGPGLALDLLREVGDLRLGARLLGQTRFPAIVDEAPFTLRIESWAARLLVTASARLDARIFLEVSLGGGFDVVHAVPLTAQSSAGINPPTTGIFPMARAVLALAWARPHIALGVSVDADPTERYVFLLNGAATTLFSANLLRPGLLLEIGAP